MANSTTIKTGGTSGMFLLGIVFLVLKLTAVINWSWWLVLIPFYLPIVIFAVVAVGMLLMAVLVAILAGAVGLVSYLFDRR